MSTLNRTCYNCEHFVYDPNVHASRCSKADDILEELFEKHFLNDEPDCPYHKFTNFEEYEDTKGRPVIYSGDGYSDGQIVYDWAECPICGYEYEEGDKDWQEPYCPHCGQKLDWELLKEE